MKIAYSAFLRDTSGFGEAARRMATAMETAGLEVVPGVVLTDGAIQMEPVGAAAAILARAPIALPDVHLLFAAAADFPSLAVDARHQVGMTCWETDRVHESALRGAREMDLLVLPSSASARVLGRDILGLELSEPPSRPGHRPRLAKVPYPTVTPPEGLDRDADLGLGIAPNTYVFYSVMTWQERKNPRGLLTAYLTKFTAGDDVLLVLKIAGGAAMKQRVLAEYAALVKDLNLPYAPPAVRFLVGAWPSERQMWALHTRGDCYVTLTRGEAFGLPILDALTVGTSVIATGWGGHLDLLGGPEGARRPGVILVPAQFTPVVQRYPHFDGRQLWADPDLCAAREAMAECVGDGRAPKIAHDLAAYSPEAVGQQFATLLTEVLGGD